MAFKASCASGKWLDASTWQLVDNSATTGISYASSSDSAGSIATASTIYSPSAAFAWSSGAPTIDGIGLRLANRTGVTGTMSVHLEVATVEVPGTLVTINVSDLPAAILADVNGGWIFFKFAAPVALADATNYNVAVKTSSSTQVVLYRYASPTDWSRYLRTTTTSAPAVGDDFIVTGERTGAGAMTSHVIEYNGLESAITDYGSGSTLSAAPALSISAGGTVAFDSDPATNYYLRLSGNIVIYAGGVFSMGTQAIPIPTGSTTKLNFDCTTNVEFGLYLRRGGFRYSKGSPRTVGKAVVSCKLTATANVNATLLSVDTDTGWLDNDEVALPTTSITIAQCEKGTLNGNANSTSLTIDGFAGVSGGLAYSHLGVDYTVCDVILLTRNVQVFGASNSRRTFEYWHTSSTVNIEWTEYKWLGSSTSLKRGLEAQNVDITCSVNFGFNSIHTCGTSGAGVIGFYASGGGTTVFNNNTTWDVNDTHFSGLSTTAVGGYTCTNNKCFYAPQNNTAIMSSSDMGSIFTNNTAGGSGRTNIRIFGERGNVQNYSNNTSYGTGTYGVEISTTQVIGARSTVGGWRIWHCAYGIHWSGLTNGRITFSDWQLRGCVSMGIRVYTTVGYGVVFEDWNICGTTTYAGPGIVVDNYSTFLSKFVNCSFGVVSGPDRNNTIDIHVLFSGSGGPGDIQLRLENCILASPTDVSVPTFATDDSWISSMRHGGVAGSFKMWRRAGILAREISVTHTGSCALSMTPNSNANTDSRLETMPWQTAVPNGSTATPSVQIYKSAAYDGAQPRLILKANPAAGIAADVVLATYTAGTGSWNAISGTTPAVTDNAVLEFYVDCTYGTGGVVYVDTVTVS